MTHRPFENLVQDLVKLHPETVSNAAQHVEKNKPTRKRRSSPVVTVRRVEPTVSVTVDPRVMATALELAGGDARRLQIMSDGSVLVRNHPRTDKPQPNR